MDFFIAGAGAAAGYLAKFWQSHSGDKESASELSLAETSLEISESQSRCYSGFTRRKNPGKDIATESKNGSAGRYSDDSWLVNCALAGAASSNPSTSGFDDLQSEVDMSRSYMENGEGNSGYGNIGDSYSASLPVWRKEISSIHGRSRMKSSLWTKRSYGNLLKPLNSLESCLMAQLYKEHSEMEEYVLSSLPSPCTPTMRTLLISDGNRIIGRGGDYSSKSNDAKKDKLLNESCQDHDISLFSIPSLPDNRYLELQKKMKSKTGKRLSGKLSSSRKSVNGKHSDAQESLDGSLLFCLGICVGIISSFLANKSKVDRLKESLNQTENLIQDLQEELEMKESLTVEELANENRQSRNILNNSFQVRELDMFSSKQHVKNSSECTGQESYDLNQEEHIQSMSKIEAELEAELERLGLNINTSNLERRMSDLAEIDPDFVADFANGEPRAGVSNGKAVARHVIDRDGSSSCRAHPANYAVSPRELSLRLHEVIQSQLEERVSGLERALEDSNRKVKILESESQSWMKLSKCELRSSPAPESPSAKEECNSMAQPLVMNLSGDALDAYNEAYYELLRLNESEEEDSPSLTIENNHVHSLSSVQESNDLNADKEEESDSSDETEKLLIKQIVEKTKKGSPIFLNANRMLFSMQNAKVENRT